MAGYRIRVGCRARRVIGYAFAHHSYASERTLLSADAKRAQRREQLTREAQLTPDQQKQVVAILDQAQVEYKAVHNVMDPQIEAVRQKTRDKIRNLLTAEQLPRFESFLRRLDEERKRASQ